MKYKVKEISDSTSLGEYSEVSNSYLLLRKVYGSELKYYVLEDKGGNLVASFCLYSFNKLWQKHIITPPFLTDIQLKLICNATNVSQINNFNRDVLSSIASFLKNTSHTFIEIALPHHINDALPFSWNKFQVGIRYTYFLDLTLDKSELLANMSTQRRKNIRDAEKLNLEIRQISDSDLIKEKANETLSSKKAKFNEQIVSNYAQLVGSDELTSIGIYENNQLLALSTCINLNGESTYLFGWNNGDNNRSFIGTYALWNCILACKDKSQLFNFAGSQIPSVEKYFRGFGGQLTPLSTVVSDKRKLTKKFT